MRDELLDPRIVSLQRLRRHGHLLDLKLHRLSFAFW